MRAEFKRSIKERNERKLKEKFKEINTDLIIDKSRKKIKSKKKKNDYESQQPMLLVDWTDVCENDLRYHNTNKLGKSKGVTVGSQNNLPQHTYLDFMKEMADYEKERKEP